MVTSIDISELFFPLIDGSISEDEWSNLHNVLYRGLDVNSSPRTRLIQAIVNECYQAVGASEQLLAKLGLIDNGWCISISASPQQTSRVSGVAITPTFIHIEQTLLPKDGDAYAFAVELVEHCKALVNQQDAIKKVQDMFTAVEAKYQTMKNVKVVHYIKKELGL